MPKQSIKPRADGRYMVSYKRHCFYGSTAKEAMEKRAAYIAEEKQGVSQDQSSMTFSEYAVKWLPVYRSTCSDKMYDAYARYIRQACGKIGKYRMRDITQTDIQAFYNTLHGSNSHIKKIAMTIRAIFRAAYADGVCLRDPTVNAKPPVGTSGTHKVIADIDKARIIKACETSPFGTAAMVMLYTGVRRGEMLYMDIDRDVDFTAKTVTVQGAISYNGNRPIISSGKTRYAKRVIPLLSPLESFLSGRHGLVLPSDKGGYMSETMLSHRWEAFKRECECPDLQMHDFRHTYTVMLFDAGVDMKTAQTWLGHADATMIMKVYDHLSQKREENAISSVEKLVEKSAILSK